MVKCRLCELPRGGGPVCGVCGSAEPGRATAELADPSLERIARGDLGGAYGWLEAEVREGRESAEYCRRLAWLGLAIQDFRAVEIWCHESLRLDSESAEPHLLLGYAFSREQRWPEAVEELEIALRRPVEAGRGSVIQALLSEARSHLPEWG